MAGDRSGGGHLRALDVRLRFDKERVGKGRGGGADAGAWHAFLAMIGSSVLLGAAFTALGYLISVVARDRGTAAGLAIGAWLGSFEQLKATTQ